MKTKKFDPFEDRLARDIRNELSRGFIEALGKGDMAIVRHAARKYLKGDIGPHHRDYILTRLQRYEEAVREIKQRKSKEAVLRGLVLWDSKLFFEVHELLEEAWHRAVGPERKVLQALIRAAGVYVHLDHGNRKGAAKMAVRALEALSTYRAAVPKYVQLELLLSCLQRLDPTPPVLLTDKDENSLVMPKTTG